jgi:hypothetical protein
MTLKIIVALFSAVILNGCSTTLPDSSTAKTQFWRDEAFDPTELPVIESKASLFALDPDLASALLERRRNGVSVHQRLDYLIATLFTQGKIRIAYTAGHSTNAAETWVSKRGDCLSLTLLTYSAAQALGLDASMQEVRVQSMDAGFPAGRQLLILSLKSGQGEPATCSRMNKSLLAFTTTVVPSSLRSAMTLALMPISRRRSKPILDLLLPIATWRRSMPATI